MKLRPEVRMSQRKGRAKLGTVEGQVLELTFDSGDCSVSALNL